MGGYTPVGVCVCVCEWVCVGMNAQCPVCLAYVSLHPEKFRKDQEEGRVFFPTSFA